MRITILGLNYSPEPSGNAPYTASLAEGLAAAGHTVHVVTGYPHYPEWRLKEGYSGWSRSEVINGVSVKRLRHHTPSKPNALARLHMELSFGVRLIFAGWSKPDVVLVVSPALFSSALAILRIRMLSRRARVGIWVQDLYSRGVVETGTGGGGLARLASLIEAYILGSTDGVIAIHERFKSHIVESLGVPSVNVEVIRNWTHLPPSPSLDPGTTRARLGWGPDDIVVLHAGNMGKKQGLENVLESARLAEKTGSGVRFVLMGDGNQRKSLEAMAAGLDRVQFVDPLPGDEFMEAMAAANVLLVNELPGVKDMAVPSKLTSYFNAGVPVVAATDAGSVTAFEIENSGGGIRVDAGDPQALLDAVEELSSDQNRSKQLAGNGMRFRQVTLSEARAIAHYDEFLSSLASVRGR
ncbi:glycosyltransferase family 4 protein [Arthrobacter sp. FW306-04-A]|uniref:glycosyltransferase family 4 protein n=1 Tax=Arthrobacter sp. FW306-04-A TaxID=2879619 RepID=UPI0037C073F0|nr:glycosyltransferase family 4 protein [Arthrobacter sp. FW306-04-A]